jgi:hypothetical protein
MAAWWAMPHCFSRNAIVIFIPRLIAKYDTINASSPDTPSAAGVGTFSDKMALSSENKICFRPLLNPQISVSH